MKYCINCGHILPDFANFCPICGQKQFDIPEEELPPVEEPVEAHFMPLGQIQGLFNGLGFMRRAAFEDFEGKASA